MLISCTAPYVKIPARENYNFSRYTPARKPPIAPNISKKINMEMFRHARREYFDLFYFRDYDNYLRRHNRAKSEKVKAILREDREQLQQAAKARQSERSERGLDSGHKNHRSLSYTSSVGFWGALGMPLEPQKKERFEVNIFPQMVCAANTTRVEQPQAQVGGGARGAVTGFSRKSKKAMSLRLGRVDMRPYKEQGKHSLAASAYFVTLTYPKFYPADHTGAKKHLDIFGKRLRRNANVRGFVWKYELQRRGAPHFHLVIFLKRKIRKGQSPKEKKPGRGFRGYIARVWHEVLFPHKSELLEKLKQKNPAAKLPEWMQIHEYYGTSADVVYNPGQGQLFHYLVKYLGKEHAGVGHQQSSAPTGRCWGVQGEIPTHNGETFVLVGWRSQVEFHRRLRRWGKNSRYLSKSSTRRRRQYIFTDGFDFTQLLRGLEWFYPSWNFSFTEGKSAVSPTITEQITKGANNNDAGTLLKNSQNGGFFGNSTPRRREHNRDATRTWQRAYYCAQ